MSNDRQTQTDYFAPLRRGITVILLLGLFGLFILWRIDSPRVEKFRALVIDTFLPSFEWMLRPMPSVVKLAQDYQSYEKLLEQNKELRRELQQMKSWKEAALQMTPTPKTSPPKQTAAADPFDNFSVSDVSNVIFS